MNVVKVLSVIVSLAIALLALGAVGYSTYGRLMRKAEILERDLGNKRQALELVKDEFSEANQKNILCVAEKESLNKKIAVQKEQIAEIRQVKENLQKQQKALFAEKQELENALTKKEQLYLEQVKLRKLEGKAKEESFKKRARKKALDFFAEKMALEQQIKRVKAELEGSDQETQELLTKMGESKQMNVKLKLEKGEGNNQSDVMDQEDEEFREETLKFHYNAGLAYDQKQQFDLALIEYEKALEIAPDDADVHYNLAILYDENLGDKRKAIEHYRAYLKFRPDAQDTVKVNYWIKEAQKELRWEEETGSSR